MSTAQDSNVVDSIPRALYPKLAQLYASEKYDKLEFKAYDMTFKDNHRREPMIYLYLFLANYAFFQNPEMYGDDFPNAFRDAIKNAIKFKIKDRDSLYADMYPDKLLALENDMVNEAEKQIANQNWRKALSTYKNIVKLQPDNQVFWMMKASLEVKNDMIYEAQKTIEIAYKLSFNTTSLDNLPLQHQELLRDYLVTYCSFWIKKNKSELVKPAIIIAQKYFSNDDEYQVEVDEIMNPQPEENINTN